jgi:hypothetical protein
VTVDIDSIAESSSIEARLDDVATYTILPKIRYRFPALMNLRQPIPTNVTFGVEIDGQSKETKTETIKVRSVNDVLLGVVDSRGTFRPMNWALAAFVNENHPWIDALLKGALH